MYGMTPEERFTVIENLLAALTEAQIRNEAQIEAHRAAIEKQGAGICDLVAAINAPGWAPSRGEAVQCRLTGFPYTSKLATLT